MLTGDREAVAANVAGRLGIDEYHSELLPADKVEHVERLLRTKGDEQTLAFVGDGINDAPVLARADVGIAMGALGSDAAIEAADVVLMDDKPSKIATAIAIARRTIRIASENAWFAIVVKVLILLLAASGVLGFGYATGRLWRCRRDDTLCHQCDKSVESIRKRLPDRLFIRSRRRFPSLSVYLLSGRNAEDCRCP